jgi:hypothetical protein
MRRMLRAMRTVATDRRVPRPLRGLLVLAVLPIPGPFDEALLLLLVPVALVFYRDPLVQAWKQAARDPR